METCELSRNDTAISLGFSNSQVSSWSSDLFYGWSWSGSYEHPDFQMKNWGKRVLLK